MSRRGSNDSGGCLFWFIFIVGGAVFLIMTAPVTFFLVVLPLAIFLIVKFIKWLRR